MKKILIIFAILFAGRTAVAQVAAENLWYSANAAYTSGEYKEAVLYYDSIQVLGYTNHKVYYNLGNAYFKDGNIGKAILNYERALNLKPTDGDVKYNLRVANGYIKDKIDTVPEFFLFSWIKAWRMSQSSNAWAYISIVFFILALAAALLYLLSGRIMLRKTGFYTAIVSLCMFVLTLAFSATERRQMLYSDEAVVMQGAAAVKSSPDNNSKELFIIHEGTKVKIVREIGEWKEIMISDGNKGWVSTDAIETI